MVSFSLDTNCLIHLDERRPEAEHIDALIGAHRAGTADVAVIAVSASERQPGGLFLSTFADFTARLADLGLGDLPQIKGTGYWGMCYWGHTIDASEDHKRLERRIHEAMFPTIEFHAADFRAARDLGDADVTGKAMRPWRSAWCDRQMVLAHLIAGRDVFVTSDSDFNPLRDNTTFPELRVCRPEEAARLIAF